MIVAWGDGLGMVHAAGDRVELRYLWSFLAVAEELHFGRAAAARHMSQPALSQHVQRLERAVGARLVRRDSHVVELTEAGRVFRVEARRLLHQVDQALVMTREAGAGHSGTVRVGFNYPAGSRVLPATLARLGAEHPRLRTTLVEKRSGPQLEALDAGELDVGFVFGPPPDRRYDYRSVLRTPLMAVVGRGHPLAGRSAVSFAELSEHACILFDRALSPASFDVLMLAAHSSGHRLDVVEAVNDSTATAVVVATGAVVGFASAVRARDAESGGLCALSLVDPEPTLNVCVVWPTAHTTPTVTAFLDCLAAVGPFTTEPR